MTAVLEVQGVSVSFGGVKALQDVSFGLEQGELLGLIGPNGAGKTTAMRCITGIVSPQAGDVLLEGKSITGLPVNARVRLGLGMSQQLVRPFKSMSVRDNVVLAAGAAKTNEPLRALLQRDRGPERARATELLELVGIADAAESDPAKLPLGYLKRLEVARALALDPRFLLLDEPLAGLNHVEAGKFADTIRDLNRTGLSIALIEHNLSEVLRICSRLVVLDNGKYLDSGEPRAVMANPVVRAAYLGEGGGHAHAH